MISNIGLSLQMEPEEPINNIRTKDFAVFTGPIVQSIRQEWKQRPAQPFVGRNIKARLRPLKNRLRQLVLH